MFSLHNSCGVLGIFSFYDYDIIWKYLLEESACQYLLLYHSNVTHRDTFSLFTFEDNKNREIIHQLNSFLSINIFFPNFDTFFKLSSN